MIPADEGRGIFGRERCEAVDLMKHDRDRGISTTAIPDLKAAIHAHLRQGPS